ncbi:hypothetical protein [Streptomyces sp. TRM49041]|uniref:hypothetical protein n=1 Tax=Streptomyces sp. TRM49041 TaxID=2603216 RepID=UPI0021CCF299|nr:hypothetical protein [Streptomyces sp. TRM49041]
MTGTRLRGVRAAIFTALVVTLSVASHVLLSRVPLPLTAVLLVAGAVFALAYALAGRERGFWPIAGLLVPLELAADTVFTAGQHACYGPSGGPVAGSLRAVGVDVLCGDAVGTPLPGVAAADTAAAALLHSGDPSVPWLLLAAHITVGLVTAGWLRRGEAALARVLRAVASFTFRPLLVAWAVVAAAREDSAHRRVRAYTRPRGAAGARLLVHSVGRRGPPCRA